MSKKIKWDTIGLVITNLNYEKKKDELIEINNNREWLKNIYFKHTIDWNGYKSTSSDISVSYYILYNFLNIDIDIIDIENISKKRFENSSLVFFLIYDLLESFHNNNFSTHKYITNVLKNSKNLYPPYKYQKYINNKCNYYEDMKKKKINIANSFCLDRKSFKKKNIFNILQQKIKKELTTKENLSFICKPILGQESKGFKKFEKFNKDELNLYLIEQFLKYPGIIFQEYVPGFDKAVLESRVFYCGDNYQYTILTSDKGGWVPKEEGGKKASKNLEKVKKLSKNIINKLPKIVINKKILPKLLTRIDISCCTNNKMFVNEIEFVPSLYMDLKPKNLIDKKLGEQIIKIIKIYNNIDIIFIEKYMHNEINVKIKKKIISFIEDNDNEYMINSKIFDNIGKIKNEKIYWYIIKNDNEIFGCAIIFNKIIKNITITKKYIKSDKIKICMKLINRIIYDLCQDEWWLNNIMYGGLKIKNKNIKLNLLIKSILNKDVTKLTTKEYNKINL